MSKRKPKVDGPYGTTTKQAPAIDGRDNGLHRFPWQPPAGTRVPVKVGEEGETLSFDVKGKWTADAAKGVAKRITGGNSTAERFFVKFCNDGPDKGHILNPHSVYYNEGDDVAEVARRGGMRHEFRRVSREVFESYLSYLRTGNYSYYQAAEQGALNG